jgi:hypothetical protein
MVAMTEPNLISLPDFREREPWGRTKVYEMIEAGELETVYQGKRRYIVTASYRAYIERLRAESNSKRQPSPNPRARSYVGPGGHPPPATAGRKRRRRTAR